MRLVVSVMLTYKREPLLSHRINHFFYYFVYQQLSHQDLFTKSKTCSAMALCVTGEMSPVTLRHKIDKSYMPAASPAHSKQERSNVPTK